jgi:transglutaminase-like putative cysteine protease
MIPAGESRFRSIARSAGGDYYHPYNKARGLYDYVIGKLEFDPEAVSGSEDALDNGISDSRGYSLLFCTLCRSLGIPARPVAGVYIRDDGTAVTHWWAEFFLEQAGWVPADPALADSSLYSVGSDVDTSPADRCWSREDGYHIAFSRGMIPTVRMQTGSLVSDNIYTYAILKYYEEGDGHIETWRSSWDDIIVQSGP